MLISKKVLKDSEKKRCPYLSALSIIRLEMFSVERRGQQGRSQYLNQHHPSWPFQLPANRNTSKALVLKSWAPGPAVSASLRKLLEVQIFRFHPYSLNQKLWEWGLMIWVTGLLGDSDAHKVREPLLLTLTSQLPVRALASTLRLPLYFLLGPWGRRTVSQGQAASSTRGRKGRFLFNLYVCF